MPQTADTLAIAETVDDETYALLKLIYRASPIVQIVRSHDEVTSTLRSYQSIRRLIFLLEGNSGDVIVRGALKSLKKMAAELSDSPLRVDHEIVFDGCNIALGCVEIAAFMKAVKSPRASGFTTYHVLEHETIVVPNGGTDAASIENGPRYSLIQEFLLPGQPAPVEMASRPGRHQLYYEYFTRRMKTKRERLQPNDRPFVYRRAQLVEKVIKGESVNDGQPGAVARLTAENASLDTMGGAPYFVVLTDAGARRR